MPAAAAACSTWRVAESVRAAPGSTPPVFETATFQTGGATSWLVARIRSKVCGETSTFSLPARDRPRSRRSRGAAGHGRPERDLRAVGVHRHPAAGLEPEGPGKIARDGGVTDARSRPSDAGRVRIAAETARLLEVDADHLRARRGEHARRRSRWRPPRSWRSRACRRRRGARAAQGFEQQPLLAGATHGGELVDRAEVRVGHLPDRRVHRVADHSRAGDDRSAEQ